MILFWQVFVLYLISRPTFGCYINGKNMLRLNYQPLSVNDPALRDKTGPEIAAKIKPKMCHLY